MLKRWTASAANSTSIGSRAAGDTSPSPSPGAATKKSSRWSSPEAVCTSMNPPAPGPVNGDSTTNDISTHATAASTALPPARSTSAPACALNGCPAATTPLIEREAIRAVSAAWHEFRHVELLRRRPRPATHARLAVGRDVASYTLASWRGAHQRLVGVARRHDRDPHLVHDLLVD